MRSFSTAKAPIRRRLVALAASIGLVLAGAAPAPASAGPADDLQLQRPRIDLASAAASAPAAAGPIGATEGGVGPGSALLIDIPDEGTFGCTANFVWTSGGAHYLGAAGHCFLPEDKTATHGGGADYEASGVTVRACIANCDGNFDTMTLVGKFAQLGEVAYARQLDAEGDEEVGFDFGVVKIPAGIAMRTSMPVFGGPQAIDHSLSTGEAGCHFGHGVVVGETAATKARAGLGGGTEAGVWMGDFAAASGDSGSAMVSCTPGVSSTTGAVGILTHLGVGFGITKNGGVQQGFVLGTTVARATELASEAGLALQVVLSDGSSSGGGGGGNKGGSGKGGSGKGGSGKAGGNKAK